MVVEGERNHPVVAGCAAGSVVDPEAAVAPVTSLEQVYHLHWTVLRLVL